MIGKKHLFYAEKWYLSWKKPAENHTVHWREFCGFHGCFVTVLLGVPLGASKVNWGQLLNTYRFVASPPHHIFQLAWSVRSTSWSKGRVQSEEKEKNVVVKITRLHLFWPRQNKLFWLEEDSLLYTVIQILYLTFFLFSLLKSSKVHLWEIEIVLK